MQSPKSIGKPNDIKAEKYREAWRLRKREGLSGSEIARRIGVNIRTVCNWLQIKRKPDNLPCHPCNIKKYHQALKLKRKGHLKPEIARMLGICPKTIYLWLKNAALRFSKYSENRNNSTNRRRGDDKKG